MGRELQAGVRGHLTLRPDRGTVRGHTGDSNKLDKKKYLFPGSCLGSGLSLKNTAAEKSNQCFPRPCLTSLSSGVSKTTKSYEKL
jgi:hypothetical protein